MTPTRVLRPCGQLSGDPSGVTLQSWARMSAPISPPPERKSRLVFGPNLPCIAFGLVTAPHDRRSSPRPERASLAFDMSLLGKNHEIGSRWAAVKSVQGTPARFATLSCPGPNGFGQPEGAAISPIAQHS